MTTCQFFDVDQKSANTIRTLSMDAIQKAKSGHPGAPLGLAAAGHVLWTRVMRHNPKNPDWPNRDRFVLSGGHASMLLYSLLHLTGYNLSLDDIKNFRQWGSKTPGHPEYGRTPGVETTTGPLGQGLANATGMAMAERHLAARFNRPGHEIVDHFTYAICGDGDLMVGLASEAASLAGHLGLARLICIYDHNSITIEGPTEITFTEDVAKRFEAYGWQVLKVADGNDMQAIQEALQDARNETAKPTLIVLSTHIAFGSPNKQDSQDAHGAPLGEEEVRQTKACLGCEPDELFCVPDDVQEHCRRVVTEGAAREAAWMEKFNAFKAAHPELADAWVDALSGFLPFGWDQGLAELTPADGPLATRAASGQVLNTLAQRIATLMGGSADLAPSNKTYLTGETEFQKDNYAGRNIRFGVREHAMGAIMSGMFLHGGIRPYCGTFLVFADYMRPAIRVAALMKLPVIYVFTHDSVAVGEDGPTHQPVEQLASLRIVPNLLVLRPCDANESVDAWCQAVRSNDRPVAMIFSRQKLPILPREQTAGQLIRGAYVIADCDGSPDLLLLASGAEVHIALEAQKSLRARGVAARVVNMPSWELFDNQPDDYKRQVLPPEVKARVAIEAGSALGWERYVGEKGAVLGMSSFGVSAPGGEVLANFGFTARNIVAKALELVGR